jgi:hypothetical protein
LTWSVLVQKKTGPGVGTGPLDLPVDWRDFFIIVEVIKSNLCENGVAFKKKKPDFSRV